MLFFKCKKNLSYPLLTDPDVAGVVWPGARDVPGGAGAGHQGGAQHVRWGPGGGQGDRPTDPHSGDTGQSDL